MSGQRNFNDIYMTQGHLNLVRYCKRTDELGFKSAIYEPHSKGLSKENLVMERGLRAGQVIPMEAYLRNIVNECDGRRIIAWRVEIRRNVRL